MDSVIKDRSGKISSKDNYRPIDLASVISKLVEVIMLDRIEIYTNTNPNQFGFSRENMAQTSVFMFQRKSLTCTEDLMGLSLYVSWMLVSHLTG